MHLNAQIGHENDLAFGHRDICQKSDIGITVNTLMQAYSAFLSIYRLLHLKNMKPIGGKLTLQCNYNIFMGSDGVNKALMSHKRVLSPPWRASTV